MTCGSCSLCLERRFPLVNTETNGELNSEGAEEP